MNITWINDGSTRANGAFLTMRSHREADGTIRLTLYFSAQAVDRLGIKRGERLLVGLDDAGTKLIFKQTLFGGNVIKGRDQCEAVYVAVTLPLQNLPVPQSAKEEALVIGSDHTVVPFTFDPSSFKSFKKTLTPLAIAA